MDISEAAALTSALNTIHIHTEETSPSTQPPQTSGHQWRDDSSAVTERRNLLWVRVVCRTSEEETRRNTPTWTFYTWKNAKRRADLCAVLMRWSCWLGFCWSTAGSPGSDLGRVGVLSVLSSGRWWDSPGGDKYTVTPRIRTDRADHQPWFADTHAVGNSDSASSLCPYDEEEEFPLTAQPYVFNSLLIIHTCRNIHQECLESSQLCGLPKVCAPQVKIKGWNHWWHKTLLAP